MRRQVAEARNEVAKKVDKCQLGGLPKRGTREAITMGTEILERFRQAQSHLRSKARKRKSLIVMLFDLDKAFDKVDRPTLSKGI